MSSMDVTLGATTAADAGHDATDNPGGSAPELHPGQQVGRYVVLERLGAGAMGVVWSAWDPELDRRVALKLLLTRGVNAEIDRLRLQREAQALAKLSHPNVVAVFDVGTHGDQLFIAMEHVSGKTLRDWVNEDAPSRDARWRALRAAGRGLAAAHGVGLVHRDFKPDNVMIDPQERVRVMDFGLARGVAESTPAASVVSDAPIEVDAETLPGSVSALTFVGALVGTPAYMAPELFVGRIADARSDLFAFCVSAWELLTGKRPFAGETMAEILAAAHEGRIDPPPAGALTSRERQILERGLAGEASRRWPDLAALLAALEDDPSARRRRWIFAGGVGVVAATMIGATAYTSLAAQRRCADPQLQLAGTWDASTRESLAASFSATGSPLAAAVADDVVASLDRWSQRWTAVNAPACTGEGTLARELRPAQARCLAMARVELGALIQVLGAADAETVRNALDAVAKLPDPDRCDDPIVLASEVSPPAPEIAGEVERVRGELARARSLRRAGHEEAAFAALEPLVAEADATGYLPLRADAWREKGDLLEKKRRHADALTALVLASELALAAGADEMAARATLIAAGLNGRDQARRQTGLTLLQLADGMIAHAGAPIELRRLRSHIAAVIAYEEGRFDDARAGFDEELGLYRQVDPDAIGIGEVLLARSAALRGLGDLDGAGTATSEAEAHFTRVLPANHPTIAGALDRRGAILYERGRYAEAKAAFEAALAIYGAGLGPAHPETLKASGNLAGMQLMLGDREGAEARYREVLAGHRTHDPDDKELGTTLCNLATVVADHDPAEAIRLFEEGLAIVERKVGAEHPELAWLALNFAAVLRGDGQIERALEWGLRSSAIREKALGPDHPHLAMSLDALGETYTAMGRLDDAFEVQGRAVEIWEKAHGPDHPHLVAGLSNLGNVELALGRVREGAEHLRRAAAIDAGQETAQPGVRANLDAGLARVEVAEGDPGAAIQRLEARLVALGEEAGQPRAGVREALAEARWAARDRRGARVEMEAALADYVAAKAPEAAARRCREWLEAHP